MYAGFHALNCNFLHLFTTLSKHFLSQFIQLYSVRVILFAYSVSFLSVYILMVLFKTNIILNVKCIPFRLLNKIRDKFVIRHSS